MSTPSTSGETERPAVVHHDVENGRGEESGGDGAPFFKYDRLASHVSTTLHSPNSRATAIAAHDRFIAIGTRSGHVYVFDHLGHLHEEASARPHRAAVTAIEIDDTGNFIVSIGADARLIVFDYGSQHSRQSVDLRVTPKSLCVSPEFGRSGSSQLSIVGDRNLTMFERGNILVRYKDTVLYRGGERDGLIATISWRHDLIAFTNDTGTRLYDRGLKRIVSAVAPVHDVEKYRTSRFRPCHCWLSDDELAIAWADSLQLLKMARHADETRQMTRIGALQFSLKLELFISGLSYTVADGRCDSLVVYGLTSTAETNDYDDSFNDTASTSSGWTVGAGGDADCADDSSWKLSVEVIDPDSSAPGGYYSLAVEELSVPVPKNAFPSLFRLIGLPQYQLYFLMTPHTVITAQPCSADDKISWWLRNDQLLEAWHYSHEHAAEVESEELQPSRIARRLFDQLIEKGRVSYALQLLPEICGTSKQEWEFYVTELERRRLCMLLGRQRKGGEGRSGTVLPTNDPRLEPECYEAVLRAALYNDTHLFATLVKNWPSDLYRVASIRLAVLGRLSMGTTGLENLTFRLTSDQERTIFKSLAYLYLYESEFPKALKIFQALKDKMIFALIEKHGLFDLVRDSFEELIPIDTDLAVRVLLTNEHLLKPEDVMNRLRGRGRLQLQYLKKLFSRNQGSQYADEAVLLFAEHSPKELLHFLRINQDYNIQRALEVCRQRSPSLAEETIYLLAKSGDRQAALSHIMSRPGSNTLQRAVLFCKEYDDPDLWRRLLDSADASQLTELLQTSRQFMPPLLVVERIKPDMSIVGLRDLLTALLEEQSTQLAVERSAHVVTLHDVRSLLDDFLLHANAPIVTVSEEEMRCVICRESILSPLSDIVAIACGHVFHERCCTSGVPGRCPLCADG